MDEESKVQLQRNVQRLLGRCLLRIQQYEQLMKAILAEHELVGAVETLADQRATRVEKFSDKSLGTLVKSLFETCVVPEGFERELLPDDKVPTDRASMAFSLRVSLEPEAWARAKSAIEELVTLRNAMVHHLVDQHIISMDFRSCREPASSSARPVTCDSSRVTTRCDGACPCS